MKEKLSQYEHVVLLDDDHKILKQAVEMLQEKAAKVPGYYDADHGFCDVYDIGIELTPIVDASLVGYSENEDGTFTMVVVLQVIHPGTNEPSEFGNDPLEVVVDMRSGHPVFLSAMRKEL